MNDAKIVICPYCGETQPAGDQCRECGGFFEAMSRQATHNEMGPWFVHDRQRPHRPGCSYETLARLVEREVVTKYSVLRGPTTKQFWTVARRIPGVAHLLGYCHACDAHVDPSDHGCPKCGVPFGAYLDRNYLGLPEIRPLPGEAPHDAEPVAFPPLARGPAVMASATAGISSFAADEELLSPAPRPEYEMAAVGAATTSFGSTLAVPEVASTAPPGALAAGEGSSFGDWLHSPPARSMQRRLARQQRTINLLMVVVIVVALAGAAINFAMFQASRGPGADAGRETPAARPDEPATVRTPAPVGMPERRVETPAPGPGDDVEPPAPVVRAPDPEAPADAGSDASGDMQRALALVASGADGERGLDDRIRDYEQALAILEPLAAAASDDETRRAIEQRVAEVEVELERLRLQRDFFR